MVLRSQFDASGSHDSFAVTLLDNAPVANDKGPFLRKIGRLHLVRRVIRRWAITQRYTVSEQLLAGVRYFDIRLTVPISSQLDGIRVLHGLYGDRIERFLVEINEFLNHHEHEIVILDFNHLYNFDVHSFTNLLTIIEAVFGSKLCERHTTLSELNLAKMWNAHHQVIAIWALDNLTTTIIADATSTSTNTTTTGHDDNEQRLASKPWIWPSSCIVSPYANVNRTDRLFCFLNATLREHCKGSRDVFFVTQAILTAKWSDVCMHPFATLESACAIKCTCKTTSWLSNYEQPSFFNIIISDFIDLFHFCDVVLSLNIDTHFR